jgi:hypothetical protein
MAYNFLSCDRDDGHGHPAYDPKILANRTLDGLEREVAQILTQAADADQREDLEHGQTRGELPEALASKAGRLARLRQAKARLEAEAAERAGASPSGPPPAPPRRRRRASCRPPSGHVGGTRRPTPRRPRM